MTDCKRKIKLSIDATGSIFKKLQPPLTLKHKHVFFYVAVLQTNGSSCVPMTQMITDSHSLGNICYWLKTWIKTKKPPHEVVCDDSSALLGAIVKAFTHCNTTREYISYCFSVL